MRQPKRAPKPAPVFFVAVDSNGKRTERIPTSVNTLDAMQAIVGGPIEHLAKWPSMHRPEVEISAYGHEEGRHEGLPLVAFIRTPDGSAVLDIVGPVLFAGADSNGETIGLTATEIANISVARIGQSQGLPVYGIAVHTKGE